MKEDKQEENKHKKIKKEKVKKEKSSLKQKFFTFFRIFFKFIFLFSTAIILAGVVIVLGIYLKYSDEFNKIKPESKSTQLVFYDKDGNEIFRDFGAAEPQKLTLDQIPTQVKQATLAAEDLEFYKHGAVDPKGILRAAYLNWSSSNKQGLEKIKDMLSENAYSQGGGSTITQQLVKNIYLTPEKSFQRKLKEIVFSYKLEKKYSKDQIFEMYLNQIYYGAQSLGIKNAAHIYFNKDVKDLNLAEISMLAGLPQAPTYYSPLGDNYLASKKRQEYVLQQMYLANFITLDEAKSAANEPLNLVGKQETVNKYPYFNQFVKSELGNYFDVDTIESQGLKVYTSLDPEKQKITEDNIKIWSDKLKYRGASNASAVVADPKTNEILAMVGGVDWNASKVNVATSLRQPGSSFKPIVYTTALENGYTAGTVFNDKYVNFGGTPAYAPHNYDGSFNGYLTMRTALARSLNVPAVEMAKMVGLDKIVDMAHKLGISSLNEEPSSYGLPLGLGSGEVRLVDMVEAFSTFADEGKRMPQTSIVKIINSKGETLSPTRKSKKQVISKETAYILSSILSDNNARSATFGTNSPLKTDKTTAVKTGTTENYSDSWTVGYSPNLVVGVWMGNNDHKPMKQVSGIEGAAYIWHDIITQSLKDTPNADFVKPDNIVSTWIDRTGAPAAYKGIPNILENFKTGTEPKNKPDLSYLKQF